MPADVIARIEELAKPMTYYGSDLGQQVDEHDPGVAGVMPSNVDDEAAEVMTVNMNSGNAGVLNVDHVYVQESNHLVEPVPDTEDTQYHNVLPIYLTEDGPAEFKVVESPPEPKVEHMNDNYNNNIFNDSTIGHEVDPMAIVITATTAVRQITEQDSVGEDRDNRYAPHSCRYHLRNRRKPNYGHVHHISHDKSASQQMGFMQPNTFYSLNIMW